MNVLVTGAAGSGKTTVAHTLRRFGVQAVDIESTPGMVYARVLPDDPKEKKKHFVDENALLAAFEPDPARLKIFTGVVHNIHEVFRLFDKVVLFRIDEQITRIRLSGRVFPENTYGKTKEAQDYIMTWKQGWEDWLIRDNPGLIVLDSTGPKESVALRLLEALGYRAPV